MYCPGCATEITENLKFCKRCGANLSGVRDALVRAAGGESQTFDWSKTWVPGMLLNEEERDRLKGITPEIKRYNEIKAGVIVACVGIGVSIFLNIVMAGVAQANPQDAPILERVWVAGIIPIMVGIALIINGAFISKRMSKEKDVISQRVPTNPLGNVSAYRMQGSEEPAALPEPRIPVPPDFSVAEPSTQRMPDSNRD